MNPPHQSTDITRSGRRMAKEVRLGVVRLDYDYPPALGDIDCPDSFGYEVVYKVVPGLTFAMCQSGKLTPEVEERFIEAIKWLDKDKDVTGISGDCGFMMFFQQLARCHTKKPVFMSSLAQLPAVTCGYSSDELIAILTANGVTLEPMRPLIKDECGVDTYEKRYLIYGCEKVPGFDAVIKGEKVDVKKVTPGIVALCKNVIAEHPEVRGFLFECTELPPYADSVRFETGLPVWDSITACNFFISARLDNPRGGLDDWQQKWDGKNDQYEYGDNLSSREKSQLVNKCEDDDKCPCSEDD